MTTIVYRDGVMAADSRAYSGSKVPVGTKTKIRRHGTTLLGCSSTFPGGGEAVMDWWEQGRPVGPELPDSFTLLVAEANGELYYAVNKGFVSGPNKAPYMAAGSGEEYALGALACGCKAVDAIQIACELDIWSSLPVVVATHLGLPPAWYEDYEDLKWI